MAKFPQKQFLAAIAIIIAYPAAFKSKSLSTANSMMYYLAVTAMLLHFLAAGFESAEIDHLPIAVKKALQRFMFITGSISFAASATLLFPDSKRVLLFSIFLTIITTSAGFYWIYKRVSKWSLVRRLIAEKHFSQQHLPTVANV